MSHTHVTMCGHGLPLGLAAAPGADMMETPHSEENVEGDWWLSHRVVPDSQDPVDCSPPGSSVHRRTIESEE